jgi:predicted lipoprotein with Yx(FWY)xxD motif
MTPQPRVRAALASLVLLGSLAACGDGDTSNGAASPTTTSPTASATPSATGTSASPSATESDAGQIVQAAESDLGTILVDGRGMTLYLFTADTRGSGASTCEGQCLALWPPLLGPAEDGPGIEDDLLGTITRSDGRMQATYDGWPLYYWARDTAPGQTTGQGVNGVWWVVSPEGEAIGAP